MPAYDRAEAAAALARALSEAGELALAEFRRGPRRWRKRDGTPVSEADVAVDEFLKERLAGAFPGYGWMSEESEELLEAAAGQPMWLVDPIDGTQSFLDGEDGWCIAAALIEEARPVVAGVLRPSTGERFAAVAGAGATVDGQPIRASLRRRLEGAELLVKPRLLARSDWAQAWPPVRTAMTPSIALRLCQVASGRYDATLSLGHKADWDLAAGDLIVHEAGGRVSDLDGAPLRYGPGAPRRNGFVAAGRHLHAAVIARTGRERAGVSGGVDG